MGGLEGDSGGFVGFGFQVLGVADLGRQVQQNSPGCPRQLVPILGSTVYTTVVPTLGYLESSGTAGIKRVGVLPDIGFGNDG